jgi:hypothetical protein
MAADWSSRRADAQIIDHILERPIDYRRTAVVEGPDLPRLEPGPGTVAVRELTHDSDSLAYEIDADRSGFLVISMNFYPGWTATVDGRPARIYRTNYTSMGVVIPAGRSKVELRFATPGFRLGALVTAISTLLCGLVLLIGPIRNRRCHTLSERSGLRRRL